MEQRLKKAPVLAAGFLGMIFFGVAFVIMGAVLPSLIDKFELNTASASTLAGLLPLGILLGSVLFGPVIDRFGYKILIITSSIVTIAGLELLSFASTVPWIRFSIFLIGVGGGTLNGLTNALVSDISDSSNRASNLSILGVFYTIGAIAVPILFATLSKSFSYNILVSRAGVIMIFVLFFQSGMEGLSNNWIPAYLESETQINSSIAMYALTSIILGVGAGRIVLSYLLRKISKQVVLISSMIISVIGVIILLTTAQPLIGTFLLGLGFASTFPIVLGQLGEKYKEMSGTAFSFALVVALSGNVLLNLLVGVVSLSNLLFVLLLCITAIILLYSISLSFNK